MITLILFFALALGTSFLCSLLEAVTLSLTHAYVAALETRRPRSASLLRQIMDRIDRPLSAILTLNTVANTIGAVGVGAQAGKLWGNASLAVTSGVLTLMILVFSEIIPKTLGAVHWRRLAPIAAYWIFGLTYVLKYPITVLEVISGLMIPQGKRTRFCREEMMASVRIGTKEGVLRERESRVIHNMLHLRNIRVKDILTPRSVVMALSKHQSIAQAVDVHSTIRFSRIPVYNKDLDDIIGIVSRYRMLQSLSDGKGSQELLSLVMSIHAIPETKSVASALDAFIQRKEHIFLVVDEYGGTAGILTLEDAIETLLGVEIVDELDKVEDMRKWAVQLWKKRQQMRRGPGATGKNA
jgi:CBS domain containing-hemolysin-like protein